MGVFEVQGPDGKTYEVEAPSIEAAAAALQPAQAKQQPGWWQRNVTGVQDQRYGDLESVRSQFPELEGSMGRASLAGASDKQLADIFQKALGDRFIRRETDDNGYDVFVTRGSNGQEQKGYLNQPGLDGEDLARGIRGALPYLATGGAAGLAGRGIGLVGNIVLQGGAAATTSAAGDMAQTPMGSEQGIEADKAAWAGTLGAAGPAAGRAVGNMVSATKNYLTPATGPLAGSSRKAVSAVEEAMLADGNITPNSYASAKGLLGPEAMLGDMGATLQGDAAVLARTPGATDIAARNLRNRQAGAADRIRADIDANIGPERNLPEYLDQQSKTYNALAKPNYDAFYASNLDVTGNVEELLKAAKASGAYDRAVKKMMVKRLDPNLPENNGQFIDLVKRELDGLAGAAKTSGNRTDFADYSSLSRDIRREIDEQLSPGNPSMSSWAQARSTAGQGLEGREAAELGSKMFSGKKDPHIVQAELDDLSSLGQEGYREGARNDLRQIMGRASSNFGPKGDSAARRALNNEFARENLEQIAGPQAAYNIQRRIGAENHFAELHDLALGNSKTDAMQAARKRLGLNAEPGDFASQAGKKGPTGLATEYSLKALDALLGGQMKKSQTRKAVDMARILTANGLEGDEIAKALFSHIAARKSGGISGQKYDLIVRELMRAGAGPTSQQLSN